MKSCDARWFHDRTDISRYFYTIILQQREMKSDCITRLLKFAWTKKPSIQGFITRWFPTSTRNAIFLHFTPKCGIMALELVTFLAFSNIQDPGKFSEILTHRLHESDLIRMQSTPGNSNLQLTRSNFHFPSGRFLYNVTLDNSNSR